jgi:uncharacterized protein
MSGPSGTDSDPSMDDILASIRKIISDDEARAQVGQGMQTGPALGSGAAATTRAGPAANREDVLLLTDLIEEPKSSTPSVLPTPLPMATIDPIRATEMPQPNVVDDPTHASPMSASPTGESSLVGAGVMGAASSAFERLNQAIEERKPAPVAVDPGPALGAGGKTIEDLVREMLRPMLKEWLDRNLPPMVERLVEREITRLTHR